MFASNSDRSSAPAGLPEEWIIQPIREALALGKSLGPILHLVTIGFAASWVIAVFFGVGFYFLMHDHPEQVIRSAKHGPYISASVAEGRGVFQKMSRLDQLLPQPSKVAPGDWGPTVAAPEKKNPVYRDGQAMAPAEPVADPISTEVDGYPLSANLGTTPRMLGELPLLAPPPNWPSDAIGTRNAVQTLQSGSPHRPHRARPKNTRSIRVTGDRLRPLH
jgi:hypothetical protein